jgi:hypothetical protein
VVLGEYHPIFNICQGPATLHTGLFGATEPADSAVASPPSSSVWTDVGGIMDGSSVLLEVDLTYTDQGVDQLVDAVGARLTKRTVQLTAALEELTLQNMLLAQNQLGTITTASGYSTYDPSTATSATQPSYTALIIDGWAPTLSAGTAMRRRIILRKALSSSKLDLEYEKSKPGVFNTTWTGYYVSSTVPMWHVIDQTS